ncbi:MAG: protein translocase subunit SecD [Planctomycetia bacterium]|nr:protein translocase subunit SecD [Planctomycetia bacterium]
MSLFAKLLLIAGVFAVPIVLANILSKSLRLPDQTMRFFVVIFAVVASLAIVLFGGQPKLGIDLRGGVILVYELLPNKDGALPSNETMDKLVGTVKRRVDPGNVMEITVRPYGTDKIEVIVPSPTEAKTVAEAGDDQEELRRIKYKISTSGALEFRMTANAHKYQRIIDRARDQQRIEDSKKSLRSNVVLGPPVDGVAPIIGRWIPIANNPKALRELTGPDYETRVVPRGSLGDEAQVLVVLDNYNVTGDYLSSASSGLDEKGKPAVFFSFNSDGAQRFERLTSSNLPENNQYNHLGIILDGTMQSAPRIITTISDRGQITGSGESEQESKDLAEILTAGGLPAALNKMPVSEQVVSATLGRDTIQAGVYSMLVATLVVVVFMLIYYRFAGLVANLALLLNVLLIVAFMIMFNAAFTLSGLAGLALTVGMAVDANVLIYERMREELNRGATLRMAIRNGFDRATVTIVDANVTTLITAIVLYVIGTDQIKGFAVTLTVGILMNLFTAITCTRLMFDVAERNRWVSNLKFMQIMSNTNYDFIGKRFACYTASILFLSAGLIGAAIRGSDLLNIDFTGGTSVTTVFDTPPAGGIAEVREKVESVLPEATVQEVTSQEFTAGTGYKIVTAEPNRADVEGKLKTLFGQQLKRYRLEYGALVRLDEAAAPAGAPATGPALTPPANNRSDSAAPVEGLAADSIDASGLDEEVDSSCQPAPTATPSATAVPSSTTTSPAATAPLTTTPTAPDVSPFPSLPVFNTPSTSNIVAPVDPFAGGTLVELNFTPKLNQRRLEELVKPAVQPDEKIAGVLYELSAPELEVGSSQSLKTWRFRVAASPEQTKEILTRLENQLASSPFFPSSESVGAAVAGGAKQSAIYAMLVSLFLVMLYVWFRFQDLSFGFAAILALVHDVLFTVGCLALSKWLAPYMGFALVDPFKIDLTIVAALLTIIGYSLNDTIVIFDRIREVRGKSPAMTGEVINTCVNQTLSRTILTSLTVFLVVVILYFWGGPGIHGFAFAMVVGTISGTYSTIYVASPILLWLFRKQNALAAAKGGTAPAIV